jgi:hypothetical protein
MSINKHKYIEMNNLRKNRGKQQKIFFIESHDNDEYAKSFDVMGSTGNVYTVNISNNTSCSCPDYKQRKSRCKHVYFILIKIMNVNENNVDQYTYTNEEVVLMFNNIPVIVEQLKINNAMKNKYNNGAPNNKKIIMLGMDDLCPICLDDMDNGDDYDHCKNFCGRAVHADCFLACKKNNMNKCVFCRNPFNEKHNETQNYVNLY